MNIISLNIPSYDDPDDPVAYAQVAIDLTGSNGDPASPSSLHFIGGHQPNQYQSAVHNIGSILAPYDHDGQYPCWGFGGKYVGPDPRLGPGRVSHCLPLTLNPDNTMCHGVNGVLNAYRHLLRSRSVLLSGPTHFEEIVRTASSIAGSMPFTSDEQNYSILLIITDGIINDMERKNPLGLWLPPGDILGVTQGD